MGSISKAAPSACKLHHQKPTQVPRVFKSCAIPSAICTTVLREVIAHWLGNVGASRIVAGTPSWCRLQFLCAVPPAVSIHCDVKFAPVLGTARTNIVVANAFTR